jgi:hypothetical protein
VVNICLYRPKIVPHNRYVDELQDIQDEEIEQLIEYNHFCLVAMVVYLFVLFDLKSSDD